MACNLPKEAPVINNKKMQIRNLIITAVAALSLVSCQSKYDKLLTSYDTDAKMKAAFEYYEEGRYNRAAELFESLSIATKGTPQDDTVQYYWAMSNYKFKDYVTAEQNFSEFVEVYPVSPFTESAEYLRIDCLYRGTYRYELDQTPTYKALTAMDVFLKERPESEHRDEIERMQKDLNDRLDKKAFEAARLYYHMEDYLAANYALKNVIKEDADNIYREEILYLICDSAYKYAYNSVPSKQYERYLSFVDDYYNFVSEYPESSRRKALDNEYEKAQKVIKKSNK